MSEESSNREGFFSLKARRARQAQAAGRLPELDGLRVLMIAMVAWFHIWQQSWVFPDLWHESWLFPTREALNNARQWIYYTLGIHPDLYFLPQTGYIWVDGTILMSVFLLYLPWAKAKRMQTPMPAMGDFYFRRARRIIPAFYFIILCHLLIVALPWNLYGSDTPWLVKDLASHLTFTFTRWQDTYIYTNLGGGAWTVAILMQGYLLFPLMARGVRKHPGWVLGGMLLVCFGYRAFVLWQVADLNTRYGIYPNYSMTVNQLVNFLDVYVIGVLSATAFDAIRAKLEAQPESKKHRRIRESVMTVLFFVSVYLLFRLLQLQGRAEDSQLQAWQMMYRPLFALCFAGLILTAPLALLPLRKLLGNPVTRFLAGVSMNFYLIHQTVAVHLKSRLMVPYTESFLSDDFLVDGLYPNQVNDTVWQGQYVWLVTGVSLVMAIAVTYLIEKPGARLFDRIRKKLAERRAEMS